MRKTCAALLRSVFACIMNIAAAFWKRQVIVNGVPVGTMSAMEYEQYKPQLREDILAKMTDVVNVLFDLGRMVHIDSSGLGVLVQILQKAKASGGKVILAALQPAPKIVFDITKVSRVFEIVPTVADAKF